MVALSTQVSAQVCDVNFNDPVGIAAITDAAMTTFVTEPDFYQHGCPGGYTAEVHESDEGFDWSHYHLMYENECVVVGLSIGCTPPSGDFYALDLNCMDPTQTGCADVDFPNEPRFLGSMSADHALDVIVLPNSGGGTGFCGGTAATCVASEGVLFRPSTIDVSVPEVAPGDDPNLVGVLATGHSWTLQDDGTGTTVPVDVELSVALNGSGTHDISSLGLVDKLQLTGIYLDSAAGSFGLDNLVIDVAECGDGVLDANEVCDDGNNSDGDGCPADCSLPIEAYADADPSDPGQKDTLIECDKQGVEVSLSGLDSTGGPPLFYSWTSAAPLTGADTATPVGTFVETTAVYLELTDGVYTDTDFAVVYVEDTLAPEIGDGASEFAAHTHCQLDAQTTVLTTPPFIDACDADEELWIVGTVTASSNPGIVPPLSFEAGEDIALPVGTYSVEWTATDTSGNSTTLTQTVGVRPAIYATESVYVRENFSEVIQSVGVGAAIANSGAGVTDIRNDGFAGDISSVAPVSLGYRSEVGDVLSATSVDWDDTVPVSEQAQFDSMTIGPVVLPPPLDLSSITFPTTPGQTWVNDASFPPLPPGAHEQYTVNSGGVLRLSAGEYYFESLTINSSGKIVATDDTILYVKDSLQLQGPIVDEADELVNVVLGYAGQTLNLYHDFFGTIVAPNATVNMGTGGAESFGGVIHARVIDQRNGADFQCMALPCGSSICENPGDVPPDTCGNGVLDPGEVDVDCGGSCPACAPTCSASTYQAETMFHSTGGAATDGWNIWDNGYIAAQHDFASATATVSVTARGEPAAWEWPHMVVMVGDEVVGDVYVASFGWQTYSFSYDAPGGPEEVRVSFDNDYYQPPSQDRNLIVDAVDVFCP